MLKLSICIPTFKRSTELGITLDFLCRELCQLGNKTQEVELLIGDNNEDQKSYKIYLDSKIYKYCATQYIKNKNNIGMIDNIVNLVKSSDGQYVWILGDDDIYYSGLLAEILMCIEEREYAYIFINHSAIEIGRDGKETIKFNSAINDTMSNVFEDGREMILQIWNCSQTSLMFIGASVLARKYLNEALEEYPKRDLTLPLFFGFFCGSKGKSRLIRKVYINNIWGATSWSDSTNDVFNTFIPRLLKETTKFGYGFWEIGHIRFLYFISRISPRLHFYRKKICS